MPTQFEFFDDHCIIKGKILKNNYTFLVISYVMGIDYKNNFFHINSNLQKIKPSKNVAKNTKSSKYDQAKNRAKSRKQILGV